MRSLYAKIVIWCLSIVLLSGFAFFLIAARAFGSRGGRAGSPFGRLAAFQQEQAVTIWERDGKIALAKYIEDADRVFDFDHFLTDANGRDVLTGADRSADIRAAEVRQSPSLLPSLPSPPRLNRVRASADGRYYWLTLGAGAGFLDPWSVIPYYLVVLAAIVLLLWLLASRLVSPIQELAHVVDSFGHGNLDARSAVKRRDEIGSLSNSFNHMADRIKTLLVAERRLLQDVSHELRSPLARLSFATRLARTSTDREAANDRIKNEIDRLTELVSSLIEVTRAEGDPNESPREIVDLRQLVENVCAACKLDAQSKGCAIRYRPLDGESASIAGNSELLRRAIENVIRNGVRYAPSGSNLEVALRLEPNEAVIEIRDFGPGVPADKLQRLFEPFFRVEASRDSAEGGFRRRASRDS